MIIWTGWGILVPFIAIGIGALFQSLFKNILGNNIALFLGYAIAAATIWFLGKKLNTDQGRVVIDKETKQEITLKKGPHTLFWIPFQYWAIIVGLVAVYVLFSPNSFSY